MVAKWNAIGKWIWAKAADVNALNAEDGPTM